jgi:predicted ATPase
MRAVFDQSWRMLSGEEQAVFIRLAVFRGGFRRIAAEQVAGATLSILSALVNKSLLQWEANGRYQVHELLRQYAEEQLAQSPEARAHTLEQHGAYFARLLAALTPALKGHGQLAATGDSACRLAVGSGAGAGRSNPTNGARVACVFSVSQPISRRGKYL